MEDRFDAVIRSARPGDAPDLHALHAASVRALGTGHDSPDAIDAWLSNRAPSGSLGPIERGAGLWPSAPGFAEIRRSTVRRNQVDIPVIVME
jgi:hypothetical protein